MALTRREREEYDRLRAKHRAAPARRTRDEEDEDDRPRRTRRGSSGDTDTVMVFTGAKADSVIAGLFGPQNGDEDLDDDDDDEDEDEDEEDEEDEDEADPEPPSEHRFFRSLGRRG